MRRLTTTSYLILGILASRDWTAYELAEQIDKGVTEIWPIAGRQLYNAPKLLLEQGLVSARKTVTGRRERTIYSITPAGREALRSWLPGESKPPALEFEAMVRLVLADQGEIDDLRRTLQGVLSQARSKRKEFDDRYRLVRASGGGTFPERQHLFALSTAFMVGHFAHLEQWASWALEEIKTWDTTGTPQSDHPE